MCLDPMEFESGNDFQSMTLSFIECQRPMTISDKESEIDYHIRNERRGGLWADHLAEKKRAGKRFNVSRGFLESQISFFPWHIIDSNIGCCIQPLANYCTANETGLRQGDDSCSEWGDGEDCERGGEPEDRLLNSCASIALSLPNEVAARSKTVMLWGRSKVKICQSR